MTTLLTQDIAPLCRRYRWTLSWIAAVTTCELALQILEAARVL